MCCARYSFLASLGFSFILAVMPGPKLSASMVSCVLQAALVRGMMYLISLWISCPQLQAALVRGLSILSKVPLIVTLIDLGVGPVFQNDLSCRCVCVCALVLDGWVNSQCGLQLARCASPRFYPEMKRVLSVLLSVLLSPLLSVLHGYYIII